MIGSEESAGSGWITGWKRTAAALVDIALFVLLGWLARTAIIKFLYGGAPQPGGPEAFVIAPIACLAIYLPISLAFASQGQSVGKKVLGVQVVGSEGKPLSVIRYTFRRALPIFLILMISVFFCWGLPLLVDLSMGFFRKDHRCGHDLITGTTVVTYRKA